MRPMVDADGHLDELLDEGIACLDSPLAEEVIAGRGHSPASHWQVAGNRARTLGNDSSHRSDRVHLGRRAGAPSPSAWCSSTPGRGPSRAASRAGP